MAAHGWRKSPSVIDWLMREAHSFDFFQAVALIEKMVHRPRGLQRGDANENPLWQRQFVDIGATGEPSKEALRFHSTLSLAFPTTDIDSLRDNDYPSGHPPHARPPYSMLINFLSLAGALGPLPAPFAELILQRASRKDTAARDFLDIFNHRIVSIAYRIKKQHQIGLGVNEPIADHATRALFSLVGLSPAIFQKETLSYYSHILHCAGAFVKQVRSMTDLLAILRHQFRVPFEGIQLTGGYYPLEEEDQTAIGPSGKNRLLGQSAMIGTRVWDQTASFEIRVGPLKREAFLEFLPGGNALLPLCQLIRLYVGNGLDFSICLVLEPGSVEQTRLGRKPTNLLRYTAWAGRSPLRAPTVTLSRDVVAQVLARGRRNGSEGQRGANEGAAPGEAAAAL